MDPIGEIIDALVTGADDDGVDLDLGDEVPETGRVVIQDLGWADRADIGVGERISVLVCGLEPGGLSYRCSAARADALSVWDAVEALAAEGDVVPTRVVAEVRGGASVDLMGMRGFLPQSQVDVRQVDDLSEIVGATLAVKILEMDRRKGLPVVSRRAVLEEENLERAKEILAGMEVGAKVSGEVVRLANFGAFVDIGGVDALLRTAEMSWGHLRRPEDKYQIGDEVEAELVSIEAEQGKAGISVKALHPDPWLSAADRYVPGKRVTGKVVRLAQFGCFVELEEGLDGLIHNSELAWGATRDAPAGKYVKAGEEIEVEVVEVDVQRRRLGVSRKRTLPDPVGAFSEATPMGSIIEGTVKNSTDFGVFVEVADGVEGLVHISEVSWKEHNPDLAAFEPGSKIQVKVLGVDTKTRRVALGIKQLEGDPFEDATKDLKRGSTIHGRVTRAADFGAFIEIADGVEGLVHISELAPNHVTRVTDEVDVGEEIEVYVLGIDRRKRKIALSLKAMTDPPGDDVDVDPSMYEGDASTSLGALLMQAGAVETPEEEPEPEPEPEEESEPEPEPEPEEEPEPEPEPEPEAGDDDEAAGDDETGDDDEAADDDEAGDDDEAAGTDDEAAEAEDPEEAKEEPSE